jgi:transcription antitermination factor NusG
MGQWCILRVGASRTIRLADALAPFNAWTPRETFKRRIPRKTERETVTIPIMPTYVFAPAHYIMDLIELAQAWDKACPDFSLQRHPDRIGYAVTPDSQLNPLRLAERAGTPLEQVRTFAHGERVKLTEGGFSGMSGIVETSDGKFTMLAFPGFAIPIKVETLRLLPEAVTNAQFAAQAV